MNNLLRQLPITSSAARYETLESYLRRLENLNHLAPGSLAIILSTKHRPATSWAPLKADDLDLDRLSMLTGYNPAILRQAIADLSEPVTKTELFHQHARPACPQCSWKPGGLVRVRLPLHSFVCTKHKKWIGSAIHGDSGRHLDQQPFDIRQLPDIITAQHRHRRLVRAWGDAATAQVLRHADSCFIYWAKRSSVMGTQNARLRILISPEWKRVGYDDPVHLASYYPELIALTSLMASHSWRHIAVDHRTRPKFFAEVAKLRSLPAYQARSYDPIYEWIGTLSRQPQPSAHINLAELPPHDMAHCN